MAVAACSGSSSTELEVIRKGKVLVIKVYRITRELPSSEDYCLKSQMNRAAISIVSNLAEGQKRGKKEFHHFINISRGSLAELRVQLDLTKELYKSTENEITMALQIHEEVGKMSWALLLRTATED